MKPAYIIQVKMAASKFRSIDESPNWSSMASYCRSPLLMRLLSGLYDMIGFLIRESDGED
jgi:hypothetical protein